MFQSRVRPVIITQHEHSRLAGICASYWGNGVFDRPDLDFPAFVRGVTLHDWHYGLLDNLPIIGAPETDWLNITRHGVEYRFDNPTVDIVTRLHLKRLLRLGEQITSSRQALIDAIESRISTRLGETNITRDQYEWADKITRFCDQLAFDFSFEAPLTDSLAVYNQVNRLEETNLTYKIMGGGEIRVQPWPFATKSFGGLLVGFKSHGYPEHLDPVVIPFHCAPG
jgi:hypothetical protein